MLEGIVGKLNGYAPPFKDVREIGTDILGYLTLLILLQCVLFMFMLAEDIERKLMKMH